MSNDVNTRTRVQAGIRTGGQFASEMHSEPAGVTLTMDATPLDKAAVAAVGDLVRTRSALEMGRWQRHMDKPYLQDIEPPLPPQLVELDRLAHEFESLPRQEQDDLMDKLDLAGAKYLLEPGQKLGNDRVRVADDVNADEGNAGLALAAQKLVADAGLPGTVTLTRVGDRAEFIVEDGSIKHDMTVGSSYLSLSAESGEYDYTRSSWLFRASSSLSAGSIFEKDQSAALGRHFSEHREYAVMMDVVASSPFRDHEVSLGELNRSARTAELMVDDTEILLDVSGEEPALKGEGGKDLHPSMVSGFLNHMARQTGHANGEAFAADLREVFRETDRRLVR